MSSDALAWLERNQLACLGDDAWKRLLGRDWPETERACLGYWAEHGLPLVVTRQPPAGGDQIALGLPAPARFQRRRLFLRASRDEILYIDAFPKMDAIARQLERGLARRWVILARQVEQRGCCARVYGSRGWQALTGMRYVRPDSDIDLTMPVDSPEAADDLCELLVTFDAGDVRLDGELVFPEGSAVAWREWLRWRARGTRELMVKRIDEVRLVTDLDWLRLAASC